MAVTVNYSFETLVPTFTANIGDTFGHQENPEILILQNGNILYAFGSTDELYGSMFTRSGGLVEDWVTYDSGTGFSSGNSLEFALLTNGNFVFTFSQAGSGVGNVDTWFDIGSPALNLNFPTTSVEQETDAQDNEQIAALVNGGFVIVHTDQDSGSTSSNAINFHRYNNNGVLQGGTVEVATSINGDPLADPNIVALNNGQFAVVWAQDAQPGAGSINYDIYFRIYSSNGTPLTNALAIETGADNQRHLQVAALGDGGFVVVWQDEVDGSAIDTEIRYEIRNADGTFRVEGLIYNAPGNFTVDEISVDRISKDQWAVSFTTDENGNFDTIVQVRTNGGAQIGANLQLATGLFDQDQGVLAGRGNGEFVAAWHDTNTAGDGNGSSIQSNITRIVRTTNGDSASDFIVGDDLRDIINGGGGGDFIIGGGGGDMMDGNDGFDTVSWQGTGGPVLVNLFSQNLNAFGAAGDTVANFEAYYLTEFSDSFSNDNNGGYIYGFGGNDVLNGGNGVDILDGGAGADTLNGAGGFDYVNYNSSPFGVAVNLANTTFNFGYAVGDTYSGVEAFFLTESGDVFTGGNGQNFAFGFGGDDVLIGGANANEWLIGGDGNDSINGGSLNDLLSGGNGMDTYIYNNPTEGFDSIADFVSGVDRFSFGSSGFGKSAGHAFIGGIDFIAAVNPQAVTATGTILYATGLGILYYDPDGTGSAAAFAIAQIAGAPALQASDFVVV